MTPSQDLEGQVGEHSTLNLAQMEENTVSQRVKSVQEIEGMLKEVGNSFQRMGTLVKMQEVMIDRWI